MSYRSNMNSSLFGAMFAVVHNGLGQTISFSGPALYAAPYSNGTAYPTLLVETPSGYPAPLSPGDYNVSIFAITMSGVAVSNVTRMNLVIG